MASERLIAIWLLVGGSAAAMQFPVEIVEQFDEARVVAFIQPQDLTSAPVWDPLAGPPPLTVAEAVAAVKARRLQDKKGESLSIEELELRKISDRDSHWHYLIKTREGERVRYYVVLMNGKVIPSVREPEAVK